MYKKDSLTNKILNILGEKTEELLDLSFTIMFNPRKLMRGMGIYTDYNKKIYNLTRSPYFIVKNNDFYLSPIGRMEIIKNIIKIKKRNKKWDKKWRAVIFDMPERNRYERNFLRRELKWMGFKELQHSVWITPHDVEKELLSLLRLWRKDFKGDIRFLIAEKIINDKDFKKIFNLNK